MQSIYAGCQAMTTQQEAAKFLRRAYPVFLEYVDGFEGTPVDAGYVLDALAKLAPDASNETIIEIFQRCVALSDLMDRTLALFQLLEENDGLIFSAAAECLLQADMGSEIDFFQNEIDFDQINKTLRYTLLRGE